MSVITVSRQFGSGGDLIAERVCSLLGYRYLDKWLLRQTASEVGLSQDEAVDFSEDSYKARSFFESLFGPRQRVVATITTRSRDASGVDNIEVSELDEGQAIGLVKAAVLKAYEGDKFILVGRGSQAILHDKPGVLHVRIVAPTEQRIERIREQENVSASEAYDIVARHDLATSQYLERFFQIDVDDPALYHLIINTGKCDIEAAAQIITSAVAHLEQQAESAPS